MNTTDKARAHKMAIVSIIEAFMALKYGLGELGNVKDKMVEAMQHDPDLKPELVSITKQLDILVTNLHTLSLDQVRPLVEKHRTQL